MIQNIIEINPFFFFNIMDKIITIAYKKFTRYQVVSKYVCM